MKCVSFYRESGLWCSFQGLFFHGPVGALTAGKTGEDHASSFFAHGAFRCDVCWPVYLLIESQLTTFSVIHGFLFICIHSFSQG